MWPTSFKFRRQYFQMSTLLLFDCNAPPTEVKIPNPKHQILWLKILDAAGMSCCVFEFGYYLTCDELRSSRYLSFGAWPATSSVVSNFLNPCNSCIKMSISIIISITIGDKPWLADQFIWH